MRKFNKNTPKTNSNPIAQSKEVLKTGSNNLVKFSFKYLIKDNSSFDFTGQEADYFLKLIDRFKDVSSITIKDFRTNYSKSLRNHPIKWSDTTENSFGLPNEEQLVDEPFQFSVSSNKYGRVIGFFIEDVFYVVWFDNKHQLYA
jgi:hypothetical protein